MQNGKVVPGLLLAIVLASGTGWWYWSHSKTTAEASTQNPREGGSGRKHGGGFGNGDNRPVPVLAASVKTGDIRVIQTALGTVTPSAVVTVSSRVNGQLTRILFKEGQLVHAGELLAEIDPRPFQAALAQVQGQALRNQALLRNSQIDLERYKTLQGQDSIAYQQVDAQASLVQQYQGTVQADQGLVDNAKLQLSFTRITSPINGRIGLRQVDMGNNITTANTLAVVNTVDPIHVVFTLPEDRVSDLVNRFQAARKSGKGLSVEAWNRGNTNLLAKGNLLSLDNQIDTTSGTVKLKAQFTNEASALFPNQFVNIRLLSNTLRDVTIVPNTAIQHGSAGTFVYRITHGKKDALNVALKDTASDAPPDASKQDTPKEFSKDAPKDGFKGGFKDGARKGGRTEVVTVQNVRLGTVDGDNVEVIDGLALGDQIVISGIDKLKENAKVIVTKPDDKYGSDGKYGPDGESGKGQHKGHRRGSADVPANEKSAQDEAKPNHRPVEDHLAQTSDASKSTGISAKDTNQHNQQAGWKHRNTDQSNRQSNTQATEL